MSFIKFFIFPLAFFYTAYIQAQTTIINNDCKKFHIGTFAMPLEAGGEIKITRKKDYQIEEHRGESVRLKIKWVSDCEYHLTILNVLNKEKADLIGKILKVKITKVEGNNYYFSASIEGENFNINNKVTKIR